MQETARQCRVREFSREQENIPLPRVLPALAGEGSQKCLSLEALASLRRVRKGRGILSSAVGILAGTFQEEEQSLTVSVQSLAEWHHFGIKKGS